MLKSCQLILALIIITVTVDAQTVTITGNQIRVDGRPVVGIQDYLPSIATEGGLGFDGGCRRAVGDCDGPDAIGERFAPLSVYSPAYRHAGFNVWRVAVGANTDGLPVEQLIPILKQLKADGWVTWVTLYSANDPILRATPEDAAVYTEHLVGFLYNYTDIWEVCGEVSPPLPWFQAVVAEIRECDRLNRPISQSFNDEVYGPYVDINSPHWYYGGPDIPGDFHNQISLEYFKQTNHPLVFGELGNSGQNWSKQNVARVHDFLATALGEGTGIIFFNTSNAKDYTAGAANIYLGPEERAEVARLLGVIVPPPPRTINQPKISPRHRPCWLDPSACQ